MWHVLILLALFLPTFVQAATLADTTFAAVDSIVANRKVLKTTMLIATIKATTTTKFLDPSSPTLVGTADDQYILLNCGNADSIASFTKQASGYGAITVYQADGTLVKGRVYMRKDRAISFLKGLAGF